MKKVVSIAALHQALASAPSQGAEPARLALFPLELIDTSLEGEVAGIDPAGAARLRMIEAELRDALAASGRFQLLDTAPAADQIDATGSRGATRGARRESRAGSLPTWRWSAGSKGSAISCSTSTS